MWCDHSKMYISNDENELEVDVSSLLRRHKDNALILITSVESQEDLALVAIRGDEPSEEVLEQWEQLFYRAKYSYPVKVMAYPLNGTRYLIQYGITNDACRTEFISVTPESDVRWVQ